MESPPKRKAKGKEPAPFVTARTMDGLGLLQASADSVRESILVFHHNFEVLANALSETHGQVEGIQNNVQCLTSTLMNMQSAITDLRSSVQTTAADVHSICNKYICLLSCLDECHNVLQTQVNTIAGNVRTIASTVGTLQQMIGDVQHSVIENQAFLRRNNTALGN